MSIAASDTCLSSDKLQLFFQFFISPYVCFVLPYTYFLYLYYAYFQLYSKGYIHVVLYSCLALFCLYLWNIILAPGLEKTSAFSMYIIYYIFCYLFYVGFCW
jgi:hypothetical protein